MNFQGHLRGHVSKRAQNDISKSTQDTLTELQ